ncbi:MAG: glycosyltransferase family 4 protein [Candidatus Electrothrix sp. GW3-4]|uniref:glycosyltransferase family 4 protein n=1 Tax=Candidatus Electrothrix sp. GW3-4 TaxID=3126740 RepID=UPI0030D0EBAA
MKIGIFLGSPRINGGTYVIYEHGSRLKKRGHQVILVTKQKVTPEEHAWHSAAHELEWLTLEQAKAESFDMVLATWWQSPFLLHELQSTHYAYFVQSIETRFFEEPDPTNYSTKDVAVWQELCEKTYSYALPIITEATWIQEYIYRKYNNYPQLVRNGVRKDIYTAEGKAVAPREPGRFRVLVEGPVDVAYKNVLASIKLAKEAGADEIWLLTSSDVDQYAHVDRVFSQIPIHETPKIYRSCDLLLKLSYVEGMFGPPLEMFHCGGTALVYDVTGHDEYIVHDRNSYVVARDEEDEVIRYLRHLKENPQELERLKQGAIQTASEWPDWDECADLFEKALIEIAAKRPASRQYFKQRTEELFKTRKPFIQTVAQKVFSDREKAVWSGEETDKNNFAELYWDGHGKFSSEKSQWRHYKSEEWTTISFELPVGESPLWLRLDPSTRTGLVEISFLTVCNKTQEKEIISFREQDDFQKLFLIGDAKWLFPEKKNIIFSYGPDPIFVLPELGQDAIEVGDLLEIKIKLKETGIQQFFNTHQLCFSNQLQAPEQSRPWWKRILG